MTSSPSDTHANNLGGTFTFPHTQLTVNRLGYGAMKLCGPGVFGPPADKNEAISVLREAVAAGVNHIDTSDFYGPHVVNQIIKEALYPYPKNLVLVSKLGAVRGADKSWNPAHSREALTDGLHDNLRNLGLERMDIVNLRVGPPLGPQEGSIEEPLTAMAELQRQGKILHIGLSNVTPKQFTDAAKIAKIVCVQNLYNVAYRGDDKFIDHLAAEGVPYVPFFPLGGFTPLQASELNAAATEVNSTPMQVALAWLLHRAPNMLLIPGTSSTAHLRENLKAATLKLPTKVLANLDEIHKSAPPLTMPAH
jgi:pyridoxine 4-dehydrogenase